ncbi:MAG: Trp biosynthesis-associated membrane protein, partial [Micromonosporaceae bacterium]
AGPMGEDAGPMGEDRAAATPAGDSGAGRGRRQLAVAVISAAAGSGLALLGAAQVWAVATTRRPAPLSPLRDELTGAELLPWAPAVALVALAGSVAWIAVSGRARGWVATLVAGCGGCLAASGGLGLATAGGPGREVTGLWPVACLLGGLAVVVVASYVAQRGGAWPRLGGRYDAPRASQAAAAPDARGPGADGPSASGPSAAPSGGTGAAEAAAAAPGEPPPRGQKRAGAASENMDSATLWDELDSGSDPTSQR